MEIVQIVSRLPPSIDGVGDYAYLLARQLRAAHGINTQFVVCDTGWGKVEILPGEVTSPLEYGKDSTCHGNFTGQGKQTSDIRHPTSDIWLDGFPVHQLKERSAEELLRVLMAPRMPQTVLLQYVGYGYEKRGCPVWLARALGKWGNHPPTQSYGATWKVESRNQTTSKFQHSDVSFSARPRLVTMFHELYATGPIWRSSFWTSPIQKWIATSLARRSEYCFTNLKVNARILQRLTARDEDDFTVLPIFSNVGEPERLPGWNERLPRMIVFGSASQRTKVYFEHKADLEQACRAMNLEEIVDIGATFEIPPLSVRISRRGILSAQEVSRDMLAARAGFFAHPTAYLGKSGVFAAYAAHGLAPITFDGNRVENEEGLKSGEHYLSANDLNGCDAGHIEKIGGNAHRWYQGHSIKEQAGCYASIIQNSIGDLKTEPGMVGL